MFKRILAKYFSLVKTENSEVLIKEIDVNVGKDTVKTSIICPYCKTYIEERKRKFKCPQCKEDVFVRKVDGKSVFFTEQENIQFNTIKYFNSEKDRNFSAIIEAGYDAKLLETKFSDENVKTFNHLKDFIWSSYNFLISQNPSNYRKQIYIYESMARFSIMYENGKDANRMSKLALDLRLNLLTEGLTDKDIITYQIVIIGNENAKNKNCKIDRDKKFEISSILKKPILPHATDENNNYCQCLYGSLAKRDEDGDLIFNL